VPNTLKDGIHCKTKSSDYKVFFRSQQQSQQHAALACGNGGATTKVEMESSRCKDADEKKKSWEGTMPIVSLSLISFDECIEESYMKMLMH
jgi:hypothetical protein